MCDGAHKWNLVLGGCACIDASVADASVPDTSVRDGGDSACTLPSDCRTFSDYCGGCMCDVLGSGDVNPTCDGGAVTCLLDPCKGHTATCDVTHHCALQ